MKRQKWIVFLVTVSLIGSAACVLLYFQSHQKLGKPGLKLESLNGVVQVALPGDVAGYESKAVEVTPMELKALPADTTFGKRLYKSREDGFETFVSAVMMGTDRTSIHKPQYCLTGQGWTINETTHARIPIKEPQPYELPVMRLTTTKQFRDPDGKLVTVRGLYVYWFVAEDRITEEHWQRMWWMATDLIQTGVLKRWAYVSCFATCAPGNEAATFERMKQFLAASIPQFQLPSALPLKPVNTVATVTR